MARQLKYKKNGAMNTTMDNEISLVSISITKNTTPMIKNGTLASSTLYRNHPFNNVSFAPVKIFNFACKVKKCATKKVIGYPKINSSETSYGHVPQYIYSNIKSKILYSITDC